MSSRKKAQNHGISQENQLFVEILRTADGLTQEADQVVKAAGLTMAQYNVLRILRGAEPEGLPCSIISDRMISRDPDMTRLLDRMEKRHWITRERQKHDRRVVLTRITTDGLQALKALDEPVRELHQKQFEHMGVARRKALAELLEEVQQREPGGRARASK